jgi:hypothetical protein
MVSSTITITTIYVLGAAVSFITTVYVSIPTYCQQDMKC